MPVLLTNLESAITAVVVYILVPMGFGAAVVVLITIIVKSIWRK